MEILPNWQVNQLPDGQTSLSTSEFVTLQRLYSSFSVIAFAILLWDWLSNLPLERELVWNANKGALGWTFLFSRSLSLIWSIFVAGIWFCVGLKAELCEILKIFPIGYSIVLFSAHIVLIIRVYAIYDRNKKLLYSLLILASTSLCAEIVADLFVQPVLISSNMAGDTHLNYNVCFLAPTSIIFAVACFLPSVFGHILLIMTLAKSVLHIRQTRSPIMKVLQRDQILLVTLICLANFANVILVVQGDSFNFKTLNFWPALVITQVFLARLVFNIKRLAKELPAQRLSLNLISLDHTPNKEDDNYPQLYSDTSFGCGLPAYARSIYPNSAASSRPSSPRSSRPFLVPHPFNSSPRSSSSPPRTATIGHQRQVSADFQRGPTPFRRSGLPIDPRAHLILVGESRSQLLLGPTSRPPAATSVLDTASLCDPMCLAHPTATVLLPDQTADDFNRHPSPIELQEFRFLSQTPVIIGQAA